MTHYKIGVYAICKNEEQFVDRWMDSMNEADIIVVADTGSTDQTIEKLRARGATVHSITVSPWRFDTPRNFSMDMLPDDIDICVCTDLDEVFDSGWRDKLEAAWTEHTTRLRYTYISSFDANGKPLYTYLYEKIHQRKHFRWIYPVHEILEYTGLAPDIYSIESNIKLSHYPDLSKSRGQYLQLLELSAKDFPHYDRNIHYLGREYMFHAKYDAAIETLKYHLNMPEATWKDERCASMRYIAKSYASKGDFNEAFSWFYRAIAEAPYLREPYVEMATLACQQGQWLKTYYLVEEALKITRRSGTYLDIETSWGYTLYDLGAISCFYLNFIDQSFHFIQEALIKAPNDPHLLSNLKFIQTAYNSLHSTN